MAASAAQKRRDPVGALGFHKPEQVFDGWVDDILPDLLEACGLSWAWTILDPDDPDRAGMGQMDIARPRRATGMDGRDDWRRP